MKTTIDTPSAIHGIMMIAICVERPASVGVLDRAFEVAWDAYLNSVMEVTTLPGMLAAGVVAPGHIQMTMIYPDMKTFHALWSMDELGRADFVGCIVSPGMSMVPSPAPESTEIVVQQTESLRPCILPGDEGVVRLMERSMRQQVRDPYRKGWEYPECWHPQSQLLMADGRPMRVKRTRKNGEA